MPVASDRFADPLAPLLADLRAPARSFGERAALLRECGRRLATRTADWVALSCTTKGIAADGPFAAQEWASGPFIVARHLRALTRLCTTLATGHVPRVRELPAHHDRRRVLALPAEPLDHFLLPGYRAVVEVGDGPLQTAPELGGQRVHAVLGAGNVTSMPIGDALHAIVHRGAAALLKLSPLHAPLAPLFAEVFAPLIDAKLLRLCAGDATLGAQLVQHPAIDGWHLTGAPSTLAAILRSPAAAQKPWTAELGNVTPVVLVPGAWRERDLVHVARHLAALLADNAACNCVTPRVLLTAAAWPQRAALLGHLRAAIAALPPRPPWHPGVRERFARAAGRPAPDGPLPFVLRSDVDLAAEPWLVAEESFAPVLLEHALPGADALAFARAAVEFVHARCFGALAAHVDAPPAVLRRERAAVAHLQATLRHGTIATNTWAAVAYAAIAPPWGVPANAAPAHGRGRAHGTQLLTAPGRTLLSAPFRPWPRPPWLGHRRAVPLLAALTHAHLGGGAKALLRATALAVRP